MKYTRITLLVICVIACCMFAAVPAQTDNGIDPEALIERILTVDERQRQEITDVVFDAEYIEGEEKDGEFKEKVRFVKKIYVKYLADTALFYEDYLEYYKDGKLKEDKDCAKEAKDRREKKRKRKTKDVSFSMLDPFRAENREFYDIEYQGITDDRVEGYMCHHFRVTALEESDTHINGDFFFDAESFNLVRVEFEPAKLTKKMMFRLKEMNMTIVYGATEDGYWLPRQFDVQGKGKAMFFFGVKIAGTEYYRNPVINGGIDETIFEVGDGN